MKNASALLSRLIDIQPPFRLETLTQLFESNNTEQPIFEDNTLASQYGSLSAKIEQWQKLARQLQEYDALSNTIADLTANRKTLIRAIKTAKNSNANETEDFKKAYQKTYAAYETRQLSQTAAVTSASSLLAQIGLLQQFTNDLKKERAELQNFTDRQELNILNNERREIIEQIAEYEKISSIEDNEAIPDLIEQKQHLITKNQLLIEELNDLLLQLEPCLYTKKIKELRQKIDAIQLPNKTALETQYQACGDEEKNSLLREYELKANQGTGWYSKWLSRNKPASNLSDEFLFLTLVNEHFIETQSFRNRFGDQLPDEENIKATVINFLRPHIPDVADPTEWVELKNLLLTVYEALTNSNNNNTALLELLKNLDQINRDITPFAASYLLASDTNSLPPDDNEINTRINKLNEQISDIDKCILLAKQVQNGALELARLQTDRKAINVKLKQAQKELAGLGDRKQILETLTSLQQETSELLIALQTRLKTSLPVAAPAEKPARDLQDNNFHDKRLAYLETMHKKTVARIVAQFPGYKNWYEQLHTVLKQQIADTGLYYQTCQLLNDIFFELQYPADKHYSVLKKYRKLCPLPAQNWHVLIALKPVLPVTDMEMIETTPGRQLTRKFARLYEHHENLLKKHPREAKLLEELIIRLKGLTLGRAGNEPLPDLLADPRYECLLRHRGFGRLSQWLAEIFTDIKGLFFKQPENGYRKHFFFSPTRTEILLAEAGCRPQM
ncbi:hypothetical protein ACFORL_07535 [Legionella dresdenensis]|uniref:Effector protein A, substrate of the Dot/Icm secretion system n=1 Tax=Legionella dresdenensis TaxID=450200 RepID=A0ABV8CG15_9GAMM